LPVHQLSLPQNPPLLLGYRGAGS